MRPALVVLALSLLSLSGCIDSVPDPGGEHDEPVDDPDDLFAHMDGFTDPLLMTHAGDGSGRLFVVEQRGTVVAVAPDGTRTTFADIRGRVTDGGERGLLGMAFHPDFTDNGIVLLSYTGAEGDSFLERFRTEDGILDAGSGDVLLEVDQPFANHNGGHIAFGPDGHLYVGLGDGGAAGDPQRNGQDPGTLLGSILRIQVDATGDYSIPSDNPFADGEGGAPEVWLYGLRNPWRFSFDDDGDLWIGDVGQDAWEEVDRIAPDQGGSNLGWSTWEGTHHYPSGVEGEGLAQDVVFPVAQYENEDGDCSVTGGVVIEDTYYFADFCSGKVWSMPQDGERGSHSLLVDTSLSIASFGQDEDGNVYLVGLGGTVERFDPSA